jgi:transglutaminase-like putative cysteine protease
MLKQIFLMSLLFFSFPFSYALDPNDLKSLELEISQNIEFAIEREESSNVKELYLTSFFYPIGVFSSQELLSFQSSLTNYELNQEKDSAHLIYLFEDDDINEKVELEHIFQIKSKAYTPELKAKIEYPFELEDKEIEEYLAFDDFINLDDELRLQASQLAQGEDDVYKIAVKVASFIRQDIEYDLATLTQNPDQSSTDVFQSKQGVCREITNLFISMMRSLGIPARVASGYSYTESDELVDFLGDNWGGHAWAEVYMNGLWVPFDLTYDQYGYVDASHIVLDRSAFLRQTSLSLNASGFGFQFKEGTLNSEIEFEILSQELAEARDSGLDIRLQGVDELGFGSYAYLQVKVKNEERHYKSLFYRLIKVEDVEALNPSEGILALGPEEEETLIFHFKLPEDLDEGFIYTFPFRFLTEDDEEEFSITVKENAPSLKKEVLPEKEDEVLEVGELLLSCEPVFTQDSSNILCVVHNERNVPTELELCSEKECSSLSLALNQKEEVTFENLEEKVQVISYSGSFGEGEVPVSLKRPQLEYSYFLEDGHLFLNYSIKYFIEALEVELYSEESLLASYSEHESEELLALPKTVNQVDLVLRKGNFVFSNETLVFEREENVQNEESKKENSEKGIFESLLAWFLSLFN